MSAPGQTVFDSFMAGLKELMAPYAGRIEHGNLRCQVSDWDTDDGITITNIAIVYETPGGSTDQINVSLDRGCGQFNLLDDEGHEYETDSPGAALGIIGPRIYGIPEKRLAHLREEIKRQMDSGLPAAGVVGHLNRLMNSELRGGTITHLEMREAMTFAIQYAKLVATARR